MAIKYVLALSRTRLLPTPRPFSRFPVCNIDCTSSPWFPDLHTDMPFSPPPLLSPSFTNENPLPPLPPIHDDDVRTKIYTHRSFYARPGHVFEDHPDDPSPDNEK